MCSRACVCAGLTSRGANGPHSLWLGLCAQATILCLRRWLQAVTTYPFAYRSPLELNLLMLTSVGSDSQDLQKPSFR